MRRPQRRVAFLLWEFSPPCWTVLWPGSAKRNSFLFARALLVNRCFTLEVEGLHDPNAPVLLLLGQRADQIAGQLLPLDLGGFGLPGCQLWLAPDLIDAQFTLAGIATFSRALPANPMLAGSHLWAQAIEVEPAAPIAVGAHSNAGVATRF